MSIAYSGNTDSKFRSGAYEYDIRVQLDEFDRKNMDDVSNINFINNKGEKVFLYQFATVSPSTGPDRLERRDRVPSVTVKSQVLGRTVGDVGNDLKAIIEKMKKPNSVQYYYEGNLKAQDESMGSLGLALLAALAFMYLIMAALYDDFIYPFVVMFSIPLAFIGALLALALSMSVLDIFTAVGMIMMMGLVGKNAILLIDFANHAKENGQKVRDALVSAGTTRLRPILMTTIAMVFGMMPIALAKGAGAEWKNGLAWALIGGLLSSLLLTMIVVPAFYLLIDRLEHGVKSLSRRLGILKKEEALAETETSH
jgi:HAE1 family hydrophobic/amphiphilic exporter-1